MTGRNDPCPCGSGRKFKQCHGRAGAAQASAPTPDKRVRSLLEQGRMLYERKQFDAAWHIASQLPDSAQTCRARVDILVARRGHGDLDTATEVIGRWRKLAPSELEPWTRTLEIALNQGDKAAQQMAVRKLRAMAPQDARTLYYEGLLAQLDRRTDVASERLEAWAQKQFPGYQPLSWKVLAAASAFDMASGKYPGSASTGYTQLLGNPSVVKALEASLAAWNARHMEQAGALPANEKNAIADAWLKLSIAGMQGLIDLLAVQDYNRHALRLNPDLLLARSSELFCLNYDHTLSAGEIYQRHCEVGDWLAQAYPQRKRRFLNSRVANRPLKVAYLSADFRQHPVAYFILPVLWKHRNTRVRSFLYHNSPVQDDITELCRAAAEQFHSVWDFDDHALASQMERDGIDILVDLSGASSGHRLVLLAQRAAPVQITWLGYPNTTGLGSVDYRIVDPITDPLPEAQRYHREKLLALPRLFSVYDPISPLPDVAPAPCERNGYITFGSFNNINKLTDPHLATWAKLLHEVPGSKLLFKYPSLDFAGLRASLLGKMQDAGIAAERILFQGLAESREEHLQSFAGIDIHLDSFPYHGTTTSCECLVMGVPMVTLAGRDHRSRVGASLLHSVGCDQWVAHSAGDFVRIAAQLAADPAKLATQRNELRTRMQTSALMDAEGFVADLEAAYLRCWEQWCRESGPLA